MSPIRTVLALASLLVVAQLHCRAAEESCDNPNLSHSDQVDCLAREYKATDSLLQQKMTQILKNASTVDVGFSRPEAEKAQREKIILAIREADKHWRATVETECGVLVEASFGTGNGSMDASLECRISRTSERIKQLSVADAYSWLWRQR